MDIRGDHKSTPLDVQVSSVPDDIPEISSEELAQWLLKGDNLWVSGHLSQDFPSLVRIYESQS